MTLSEKDGQLYYKLWLPLLDYVNKKCKINGKLKDIAGAKGLDPQQVKEIANFISLEDEKVYQVQGIISSWEEMFPYVPLPLMLEATFIPFRDVIVSDGLVMPYNIVIGKNMAKQFKDIYMNAKKNGTLIKSLKKRIR